MTEMHDNANGHPHADWLAGFIAAARYASGRSNLRAAWWMTPIGFGSGLLTAYLLWLGGSVVDPMLTGAGVAFASVFSAPYVHLWMWNAIDKRRRRKLALKGSPHGPDATTGPATRGRG